ncbi:hypothetical protein PoB_006572700 [Plakobranchus ocellatus]|uniref:Uncharacterized protein n=1 Tax=Plakobranchus ocellatus TaxID=259542 RepID=A0AAV4D4Z0_9GAST|nr:hypothetical protein PoB_006572700 [Plakobranchus ocellatus]
MSLRAGFTISCATSAHRRSSQRLAPGIEHKAASDDCLTCQRGKEKEEEEDEEEEPKLIRFSPQPLKFVMFCHSCLAPARAASHQLVVEGCHDMTADND